MLFIAALISRSRVRMERQNFMNPPLQPSNFMACVLCLPSCRSGQFCDQSLIPFLFVKQNLLMLSVFILALMAVSALAGNYISMENTTSGLADMKKVCDSAPTSNLNLCNNTCLECVVSNSHKCAYCHDQFTLESQNCLLDINIHNYTYRSYLDQTNAPLMAASLEQFIYGDISTHILVNKVLRVCQNNSYEMFMAGPFKRTNIVGLNYNFRDPIDQIQIKFNFMSMVQDMGVYLDINEKNYFTKKFTIFSDLVGRYGKNLNNAGPNYLILNALTPSNVGSVVEPIDTGLISLINNTLHIRIGIDSQEDGYTWAISDVVIITRACETCPTQDVLILIDMIKTLAGYVLAAIVAMLVMLYLMIKAEQLHRKWEVAVRMGSSHNFPSRAADRIIGNLERLRHSMEKDHHEQEKQHRKSLRRHSRLVKRSD